MITDIYDVLIKKNFNLLTVDFQIIILLSMLLLLLLL